MRHFAARLGALLLVLAVVAGCNTDGIRVQAAIANSVALGANDALPLLVAAYRREGEVAIAQAPDRAAADAALGTVRHRWAGVWGTTSTTNEPCGVTLRGAPDPGPCVNGAWPALVAVDDAWASRLERHFNGQPLSLADALAGAEAARAAYCALRANVPASAHVALPDVPGMARCATVPSPSPTGSP